MKSFICDHCGGLAKNLHKAKFREYFIGVEFESGGFWPVDRRRTIKIDLCSDCYEKIKSMKKTN